MKILGKLFIVILFIYYFHGCSDSNSSGSATISGKVETIYSLSLRNIEICAQNATQYFYTNTGSNGKYKFTGLPKGVYDVRPNSPDYNYIPKKKQVSLVIGDASEINFKAEKVDSYIVLDDDYVWKKYPINFCEMFDTLFYYFDYSLDDYILVMYKNQLKSSSNMEGWVQFYLDIEQNQAIGAYKWKFAYMLFCNYIDTVEYIAIPDSGKGEGTYNLTKCSPKSYILGTFKGKMVNEKNKNDILDIYGKFDAIYGTITEKKKDSPLRANKIFWGSLK